MSITLTREEAQSVLYALSKGIRRNDWKPVCDAHNEMKMRLAQPEPEPVADKYLMEVECTKCGAKQDGVLTVTAPPQREWRRLTDEEIHNTGGYREDRELYWFARTIEAKLKEKNASYL